MLEALKKIDFALALESLDDLLRSSNEICCVTWSEPAALQQGIDLVYESVQLVDRGRAVAVTHGSESSIELS